MICIAYCVDSVSSFCEYACLRGVLVCFGLCVCFCLFCFVFVGLYVAFGSPLLTRFLVLFVLFVIAVCDWAIFVCVCQMCCFVCSCVFGLLLSVCLLVLLVCLMFWVVFVDV